VPCPPRTARQPLICISPRRGSPQLHGLFFRPPPGGGTASLRLESRLVFLAILGGIGNLSAMAMHQAPRRLIWLLFWRLLPCRLPALCGKQLRLAMSLGRVARLRGCEGIIRCPPAPPSSAIEGRWRWTQRLGPGNEPAWIHESRHVHVSVNIGIPINSRGLLGVPLLLACRCVTISICLPDPDGYTLEFFRAGSWPRSFQRLAAHSSEQTCSQRTIRGTRTSPGPRWRPIRPPS
jgi:hypothetical protein